MLGFLERVDARIAWPNEALDFTPWLAQPENFQVLADTLHLDSAEVEAVERSIGDFSADIVARDRDGFVLIENQLAQTDHSHLGQLLTYLAGLGDSAKVLWIATRFREEHRAAIDWLNENTNEKYEFFALELEVVKIGTSDMAPLFSVVAKPNSWSRHNARRAKQLAGAASNERQIKYQDFWTEFATYVDAIAPGFRRSSPPKDHWWEFPVGRSGFSISLIAGARDKYISAEFLCRNDPDNLILEEIRTRLATSSEELLAENFVWEGGEGRKTSKVFVRKDTDPFAESDRSSVFSWYWEQMQVLRGVFVPLVRHLDIGEVSNSE